MDAQDAAGSADSFPADSSPADSSPDVNDSAAISATSSAAGSADDSPAEEDKDFFLTKGGEKTPYVYWVHRKNDT